MRVYFDNVDLSGEANSGPHTFGRRLAIELSLRGHQLADPHDYDVALAFIERTDRLNRSKPYVHRLDGIWFHPDEISTRNESILRTYAGATRVVFQSNFDRTMVEKWFGMKGNEGTVIRNGIRIQESIEISPDVQEFRKKYGKVFVSSASWHGQKRLKSNIELYLHLKNGALRGERCCLIVLGPSPDCVLAGNDIYYANSWVPQSTCLQVYASSDWMLHLAYLDHSPNTVIEALSQGCPVICSSEGGTKEIVGKNGIVLFDRRPYDFQPCDYESPPSIDVGILDELPKIQVDRSSVNIGPVVDSYERILLESQQS